MIRLGVATTIVVLAAACSGATDSDTDALDRGAPTIESETVDGGSSTAASNPTALPAVVSEPESAPTLFAGVDISRFEVPLEEIIFDTFDGGSVSLTEATETQVLALLNAIPPIVNPRSESDSTWLTDDDLVLTVVDADGEAWAWPHRILNFHEIVSDEIDGVPIDGAVNRGLTIDPVAPADAGTYDCIVENALGAAVERKSTRLNSSPTDISRMPPSA